jgi:hypothetical protein
MVALFRLFDGAPNLSVVDPHPINKTLLNDLLNVKHVFILGKVNILKINYIGNGYSDHIGSDHIKSQ